jgi:ATP-binding cassette subfamily B protein
MSGGGALTLGTLIAFATYLQRATGPLHTLLGLYVALQRARVSLDRVCELAAEPVSVTAPDHPVSLPEKGRGGIAIDAVSYTYPGAESTVLCDARLTIPAGSKVLVMGRSGAGKSTLVDLLQRHCDPDDGVIRLDGIDLRALDPAELRRAVAVVAQDVVLFSASIAENIRYGAPRADARAVHAAARAAGVEEFAAGLPQGLDTTVGQRGLALSGGQRQRIAIARALLVEPRVLVLDEGTSAVDAGMESEIVARIDRLFAGRTRLIVSHRPLAEQAFDLVVHVDGGRLTACAPQAPCRPLLKSASA